MSSQQPPPQPGSSPYPSGQTLPPAKKSNVLKWVLIILAFVIVLGGIAVVGTGYFLYQKVKQAGLDPELAQKNPVLAAAKLAVTMNPEIEMVSVDERSGTMVLREKKTGKTVRVNLEDAKEGRISFETNEGESASVEIGQQGLEVRTKEGTFTAGAGLQEALPSWLPQYPGAKVEGSFTMRGAGERGASVAFETSDAPAKVADFYENRLKGAGFQVERTTVNRGGGAGSMELVTYEGAQGKGAVSAVAGEDALTRISINYEIK